MTQAQFAGYYAARREGLLQGVGLDVTIKVGGPSITPEQVVASGRRRFGIDWLPSLLATRDKGTNIVNIAQMFARSGMTELTWKDSGITSIAKMRNKKVGVWCCGNQFELFAALTKHGMDPKNKDVQIFNQPFDMSLFLQKQDRRGRGDDVQRARAGARGEEPEDRRAVHAQRSERLHAGRTKAPAMLEDGAVRHGDWIADEQNQATRDALHRRRPIRGWIYCRDHVAGVHEHRGQERPALAAGPSALADERDQQADLAERDGDRRHGRGGVQADRRDRTEVQGDQEAASANAYDATLAQGGAAVLKNQSRAST